MDRVVGITLQGDRKAAPVKADSHRQGATAEGATSRLTPQTAGTTRTVLHLPVLDEDGARTVAVAVEVMTVTEEAETVLAAKIPKETA